MTGIRIPDFYIVGAPKSGTTALYRYLSEHPDVFMPSLKEPHYFAQDFPEYRPVKSFGAYQALFHNADPGKLWGEASVWYLYSGVAAAEIARARPDAKIIVMLRNPAQAAQAMHAQQILGMAEDIYSFSKAWAAQADRAAGKRLPMHCPEPAMLQYGAIFSYAEQIARLLKAFLREQVKIVIHEEFFQDPVNAYGEIQDFLGLARHEKTTFEIVNVSKAPRSYTLHRFLTRPPALLRLLYHPLVFMSRRFGLHLGRIVFWLTRVRPVPRKPLPPAFRQEINDYFADDIARLEALLGRPVNIWRD